ncbi:MAG: hypothetical protein AAFY56_23445, partial [Pseudomonadota bacterium]
MSYRGLTGVFELRWLIDLDDPKQSFEVGAAIIAWHQAVRKEQGRRIETFLHGLGPIDTRFRLLILKLSTVDKHFFELAKIIGALTLRKKDRHLDDHLRDFLSELLIAQPPNQRKATLARNTVIILTMAIAVGQGARPFQNRERKSSEAPLGAAEQLATTLRTKHGVDLETGVIEKVWIE